LQDVVGADTGIEAPRLAGERCSDRREAAAEQQVQLRIVQVQGGLRQPEEGVVDPSRAASRSARQRGNRRHLGLHGQQENAPAPFRARPVPPQ
jgi:hypothetical protein